MEIRYYVTDDGSTPFIDWLARLRDRQARHRIQNILDRLRLGLISDYKSVGNGTYEIRIHYGPGYRIYFGHAGKEIILLLCGGNKATQRNDIALAKRYWTDYRSR
jgi:putative addiction module killer protein